MSGEMAVSLALKFNDQGSGQATQALQKITRAMKETGEAAKSSSAAAVSAFQKLANSREILGIRSEKAIQNEIRQTEAAYQRMVASGQAGARELSRAQDAMRQKVAGLRQEMDGVKTSAVGMGGALRVAMGAVGAYQAGKMVLQGPVSRTMNYSMEMAHASNTLFAGKTVAERIAAKQQINDAVMTGVRAAKGGVTREDALAGVKVLGASGEFGDDPKVAFAMLPTLTRAAAANNAGVTDMANIAIKAKASMGLTNVDRILDMAAQGGIEGSFETRDMAKWLPGQMASSKAAGLHGYKGLATIIAMDQMAMTTAASPDEAGNNVKNLLDKINSQDTANDFKKMGIDSSGSLAAAAAKGVGGVDAFFNLLEQQMAKDPRLVSLQKQAKTATGDDLKANLQAQIDIFKGAGMGKYLQDRQALSPAVAIMNDRAKFEKITGKVLDGSTDRNEDLLKVIADEPGAKAQLAAAEAANNMQTALNKVNPLLGAAADGFSDLSQRFPTLAAAVSGTSLGVTALGAAAFTAAGALKLMGGGGVVGAAGAAGAAGSAASTVATSGGMAALARVAGFAAAPLAAMWGASEWAGDTSNDKGRVEAAQGAGGMLSSMLRYLGFDKDADIEARRAKNREGLDTSSTTPANQSITINIDGRTVAEVVNGHNSQLAQRH